MGLLVCALSGLLGRLLLRIWDPFLCLGLVFLSLMHLLALAPHWGMGLTSFSIKFHFWAWYLSIFVFYNFGLVA